MGVDSELAYDGREHIEDARGRTRIQGGAKRVVAHSKARRQMLDATGQPAANQTLHPARDRDPLPLLHGPIPSQLRRAITANCRYRA